MKRGVFSDKEIKLMHKIEMEFELFKYRTLAKSRKKFLKAAAKSASIPAFMNIFCTRTASRKTT